MGCHGKGHGMSGSAYIHLSLCLSLCLYVCMYVCIYVNMICVGFFNLRKCSELETLKERKDEIESKRAFVQHHQTSCVYHQKVLQDYYTRKRCHTSVVKRRSPIILFPNGIKRALYVSCLISSQNFTCK